MRLDGFKDKEAAINWLMRHKGCRTRSEAEKYLRTHLPYEKDYQKKIIRFIQDNYKAFVWKAAAGPYSRAGIPDVCAVIGGRFFGFEIKRPYIGKATDLQRATIRKIRAAGGKAAVVSFPEEVARIIDGGRK